VCIVVKVVVVAVVVYAPHNAHLLVDGVRLIRDALKLHGLAAVRRATAGVDRSAQMLDGRARGQSAGVVYHL